MNYPEFKAEFLELARKHGVSHFLLISFVNIISEAELVDYFCTLGSINDNTAEFEILSDLEKRFKKKINHNS